MRNICINHHTHLNVAPHWTNTSNVIHQTQHCCHKRKAYRYNNWPISKPNCIWFSLQLNWFSIVWSWLIISHGFQWLYFSRLGQQYNPMTSQIEYRQQLWNSPQRQHNNHALTIEFNSVGTKHNVFLITLGITECHKTKLSPHNEQEGLIDI